MFELLAPSCPAMLWVITLAELVFTVLLFGRYAKSKNIIFLLMALFLYFYAMHKSKATT